MPPRKRRIPVVFDTNVIVGFYLSRTPSSANQQAFRLWRDQRKLQLIVSDEILREYLEVLTRLGVSEPLVMPNILSPPALTPTRIDGHGFHSPDFARRLALPQKLETETLLKALTA